MAERGWVAEGDTSFQLSGDRLEGDAFSVARVWHSTARLHRPSASDSDSVLVLIGVEGSATLSAGDRTWHLEPHQIVIVDTRAPLLLDFHGASARLEVSTARSRLGAVQLLMRDGIEIVTVDENYWRMLVSLIVTVLSADVSSQDAGFISLKTAIESTLTAAVMQSSLNARVHASARDTLLGRAQQIIDERFNDSQFSTGELALSLAISSAQLHRVFASASVTPYQMIQQRRVKHAFDLLRGQQSSEFAVAAHSGFSSPRAMRRALRRHMHHSESTR